MIAGNRLFPALRPYEHAVAQQGAGVLVEKRVSVARHIEMSAPGERMVLQRLNGFRVSLNSRDIRMSIVDVVLQTFGVIEASPGEDLGDLAFPYPRAALALLIAQHRPFAGPRPIAAADRLDSSRHLDGLRR